MTPGRVSIMDPDNFPESALRELELSASTSYLARADISSFFPSIYTHSIPWALVGHDVAKKNRKSSEWFNQLDRLQSSLKRDETHGIPIGPGTSHIISELILSKIDASLRERGHSYIRFIDDYKCFATNRENAEAFLRDLERELQQYLLNLNTGKVFIEELPRPYDAVWVSELRNILPPKDNPLSNKQVLNFLDRAVSLQKTHPEGSVLKFATRSLMQTQQITDKNVEIFLKRLASLAFHYPLLLPLICEILTKNQTVELGNYPKENLRQHVKNRRSDAICWSLFLMTLCKQDIEAKDASEIVETEDCMSMAMLVSLNQHEAKVSEFLEERIAPNSEYDCDRYWILIHELQYMLSDRFKRYVSDCGFGFLNEEGVSLVKEASQVIEDLRTRNFILESPDATPTATSSET